MATLHIMVGLPCSGKSTEAKNLEKEHNALLLSPDMWHPKLFGNNITVLEHDRIHGVMETIMWEHAARVLSLGIDVILDFGFLFKDDRESFRQKAKELGANFKIHYMDVSVSTLYKRLDKLNKDASSGTFVISKEDMDRYISIFQPPSREELG